MTHAQCARLTVGRFQVFLLDGGAFALDGGAMFGVVPKPLWAQLLPPDEQNRVRLAARCLLIESPPPQRTRVLVDTGRGAKFAPKEQRIFDLTPSAWLLPQLRRLDIAPEEITHVIMTHLHCDHAGGLTMKDEAGRLEVTFPQAGVYVREAELRDARENTGIMTASYRPENLGPISTNNAWQPIAGNATVEILPGVHTVALPGHTRGHQGVLVADEGDVLYFPGDLLPTRHHVKPAYGMAYDIDPLNNQATKAAFLERAAAEQARVVLDHDPETPVVRVERSGDGFALAPVETDQAPQSR